MSELEPSPSFEESSHHEDDSFITSAGVIYEIELAGLQYDLLDAKGSLAPITSLIKDEERLYEGYDAGSRSSLTTIAQRYWRNIAVFESARLGEDTDENLKSVAWNSMPLKANLTLPHALLYSAAVNMLVFKANDDTSPVETEIAKVSEGIIFRDDKGKDQNTHAGRFAKQAVELIVEFSKENRWQADDSDDYFPLLESFYAIGTAVYSLAALSGRKGVYDYVADKLEKAQRIEESNHKTLSDFYSDTVNVMNEHPEDLKSHLDSHEENGTINPNLAFIKSAFLVSLASSIRSLKSFSAEARQLYKEAFKIGSMPEVYKVLSIEDKKVLEETLASYKTMSNEDIVDDKLEILQPTSLDWEILPPGELEQVAKEIVENVNKNKSGEIKIELERLNTLHEIRELWGSDKCFYVRGNLGNRQIVKSGNAQQPDEYIVLVLQDTDSNGNVIHEHAVAESPIKGPHAAYVYRQDISPEKTSWRKIMSLPKKDARSFGARPVKHTVVDNNGSCTSTMVDKITYLLSCNPSEFHSIAFKGNGRISLGKLATGSI